MRKKEKMKKEEGKNLCEGCSVRSLAICSVCGEGKNKEVVNQVIRGMTEGGVPLYIVP